VGDRQTGLEYTWGWQGAYTDFLYLRARWYQPTNGRFTQPDPWVGNPRQPHTLVQGYAYVHGNPIVLVDPTGMVEWWWEDMLRNSHWRKVFMDSAKRHNHQSVTSLVDQEFAAVLASVVLIEGGNLGGASGGIKGAVGKFVGPLPEDIRIPIVNYAKWAEILFNRWLDMEYPIPYICQDLAREKIGYQTEGIVNVDPRIRAEAAQYGVKIHKYPVIQFNIKDEYHRADGTFDHSQYLRGQEQWVEYLAVSFEVVQKRAQELGTSLRHQDSGEEWPESVRAFSQWHKSGIVQAFPREVYGEGLGVWYGEESLGEADEDWANRHRTAQEEANLYYKAVKSYLGAAITGLNTP